MPRYSRHAREDAAQIAFHVVHYGHSTGWSGGTEQVDAIKEILRPFNITYVDDMQGRWEHREKKP